MNATLTRAIDAYAPLLRAAADSSGLPAASIELCRRRFAQLLGNDQAATPGLAPLPHQQAEALAQWPTSPAFAAVERSVLAFAEQFLVDARGISEDDAAAVREHAGESGLLALTIALGVIEAEQRLALALAADGGTA